MHKIFALIAAAVLSLIAFAGPASATGGGDTPADNKKVEFCHATGSATNPYVLIETSVSAFYNAGHIDHEGDIWEEFSYTEKDGDVVTVPAQGDTSLLAFEDCQKPVEDEKVAKPNDVFVDKCGTKDDLFSVAPGRGYTVGPIVVNGSTQSITVTLDDGFTWTDESTDPLVFTRPVFTDEDCDLPETGVGETVFTAGGIVGIVGLLIISGYLLFTARRRTSLV